MAPAPRTRVPKGEIVVDSAKRRPSEMANDSGTETEHMLSRGERKLSLPEQGPKVPKFLVHRRSSGGIDRPHTLALRGDDPEIKEHLKHLGPSNAANRPKSTRINTVKIKPGLVNTIPEHSQLPSCGAQPLTPSHAPQGGIGEGLFGSAGREASDGVHSVAVGYGTMGSERMSWKSGRSGAKQADEDIATSPKSNVGDNTAKIIVDARPSSKASPEELIRSKSVSTIASLRSTHSDPPSPYKTRQPARSGSISENIVDLNGVKKIVLETTSSSDSEGKRSPTVEVAQTEMQHSETESHGTETGAPADKKKKRKKRGKKKKHQGSSSESQPLLGGDHS